MRSVAFAVCLFLNVMLFGICGYMYLLWLQYWRHLWHEEHQEVHYEMNDFRPNDAVVEFEDPLTRATVPTKTVTPKMEKKSPLSFLHRDTYAGGVDGARLMMMKGRIIARLRQALFDESNNVNLDIDNPYGVELRDFKIDHENLVCDLREKLGLVRTLKKSDVDQEAKEVIPDFELFSNDTHFNTCAIVTSAGSLYKSKMGRFIDSNDLVLRFNNAPTEGYERDVGSKTTIRILNSQILSKSEFNFLTSRLYKNTSLLVWDPSNYSSSLQNWWKNPEHNFIQPYIDFRKRNPTSNFHILDPSVLWLLWDFIQGHTSSKIRPNPPSSGFLGIALLLPYCSTVNVVEYVPSQRSVQRCHYYAPNANSLCTYGVWHPLAAEKLISYAMNTASDRTVFYDGFISILLFSATFNPTTRATNDLVYD